MTETVWDQYEPMGGTKRYLKLEFDAGGVLVVWTSDKARGPWEVVRRRRS